MFCNDCGAENPDTAKFCSNCGAAIGVVEREVKYEPEEGDGVMNYTERKARTAAFMKNNPGACMVSAFYWLGALFYFSIILLFVMTGVSPNPSYLFMMASMIACAYLALAILGGCLTGWLLGMGASSLIGIYMIFNGEYPMIVLLLPLMIYMWRNRSEYGVPRNILSKLTNDYKELNELRKS